MSEPEAVTRARTWIPLPRGSGYPALELQIMTDLLAAYDELRGEVERVAAERDRLAATVERVRELADEWQSELDAHLIRTPDARHCWGDRHS